MREIMIAMSAVFVFSGVMATATIVRARDSKTITKRNHGDKTVIKENNDHVAAD